MRFLLDFGYKVFPVNPNIHNIRILGQQCYPDLSAIKEKIDMVDVFRSIEHLPSIANEAIKIKAKIFGHKKDCIVKKQKQLQIMRV